MSRKSGKSLPDIDDVLDAAPKRDDRALQRAVDNLAPVAEVVRSTLLDAPAFALRLEDATPQEREQVNRFHHILVNLANPIQARIAVLDQHVRRVYAEQGAKQLPLTGKRVIEVEPGPASWDIQPQALRKSLLELVEAGLITQAEVDEAITEVVSYKVNHNKLNYLSRNRGADVQAAIDGHRRRIPPDPYRAKVRWPEVKED